MLNEKPDAMFLEEEIDGYEIYLTSEPEDCHPLDHMDFEDEKESREYLAKIQSGELGWFCAVVSVWKNDELKGYDTLGCCDYPDLREFKETGGYYTGLRNNALDEAKRGESCEISFNAQDVLDRAEELEIEITLDRAVEIIKTISKNLDAEVGINWSVIDSYM